MVQELVINDDEDWDHTELGSCSALIVCVTLVQRITALVRFRNGTEDGKIVNL